jgi:hypothetical protein
MSLFHDVHEVRLFWPNGVAVGYSPPGMRLCLL